MLFKRKIKSSQLNSLKVILWHQKQFLGTAILYFGPSYSVGMLKLPMAVQPARLAVDNVRHSVCCSNTVLDFAQVLTLCWADLGAKWIDVDGSCERFAATQLFQFLSGIGGQWGYFHSWAATGILSWTNDSSGSLNVLSVTRLNFMIVSSGTNVETRIYSKVYCQLSLSTFLFEYDN